MLPPKPSKSACAARGPFKTLSLPKNVDEMLRKDVGSLAELQASLSEVGPTEIREWLEDVAEEGAFSIDDKIRAEESLLELWGEQCQLAEAGGHSPAVARASNPFVKVKRPAEDTHIV